MNNPYLLLKNAPLNQLLEVKNIMNCDQHGLLQHGITPGEKLRIISNYAFQPMLIEVRNAFIALDNVYAVNILVEKLQPIDREHKE